MRFYSDLVKTFNDDTFPTKSVASLLKLSRLSWRFKIVWRTKFAGNAVSVLIILVFVPAGLSHNDNKTEEMSYTVNKKGIYSN